MEDQITIRNARGDALRSAREQAHLSARALAGRVNSRTEGPTITDHAIYSYERGKVLLPADLARRLARVLRVPEAELLAGDPDGFDGSSAVAGPLPRGTDEQPADRSAFEAGVVLATADEMLEVARFAHQSTGSLAQALRMIHGREVDCRRFTSAVETLLSRLEMAGASSWARRVKRASSRYEDVAELADLLQSLRERLQEDWLELADRCDPAGGRDPARAVAWCRRMARDLTDLHEKIVDAVGRCEAFAARVAAPFTSREPAFEARTFRL